MKQIKISEMPDWVLSYVTRDKHVGLCGNEIENGEVEIDATCSECNKINAKILNLLNKLESNNEINIFETGDFTGGYTYQVIFNDSKNLVPISNLAYNKNIGLYIKSSVAEDEAYWKYE